MDYQLVDHDALNNLTYDETGDLRMGSKGQLPLDFFEIVGICDGAPSNVF